MLLYRLVAAAAYVCMLGSGLVASETQVAYVFAGSARSFLSPFVRASISRNLLASFCPSASCRYDVFVRISADDNVHTGIDAAGVFVGSNDQARREIVAAIKDFQPNDPRCSLFAEYYEIGSKEELEVMVEYGKEDVRHKIYRELDSRRYSMFFGRWKAFEMMLKHEKDQSISYDWVVHARLDAAWGSPINPVNSFMPGKIYAPDTWHVEIPDTFALMTRPIANIYFGMEQLMHPRALCLGGPNLDTRKLNPNHLRSVKGYNQQEILTVQREDCRSKFPEHGLVIAHRLGLNWTTAGYSEFILKRKLQVHGFTIGDGSIMLMPFFMFLVRPPQDLHCYYLEPYHMISWVKLKQAANAALYPACLVMKDDLVKYASITDKVCAPIDGGTQTHVTIGNWNEKPKKSCLQVDRHTNMNFLPFRLRSSRMRCMTFHANPPGRNQLKIAAQVNMTSCINNKRVDRFMEQYAQEQLYHFYPLLQYPQKIVQQNYYEDRISVKRCLTAVLPSQPKATRSGIPIVYDSCQRTSDRKHPSVQMFRIIRLNSSRFDAEFGKPDADYHQLQPLTNIMIQWQYPPAGELYCLTHMLANESLALPSTSNLMLRACQPSTQRRQSWNQVFTLERTRMHGTPYRPGITIGKYPTWRDP
jgi:hypothetical protein